jgi:hypothetical protein
MVSKGKISEPLFGVLYGVEGIGKTTFGAQMPDVIFLGPETSNKFDVARFPAPTSWADACDQVKELITADHSYKSLCVDSIDHLENILIADVCKEQDVDAIEKSFGDFGKWVGGVTKKHQEFINLLLQLRAKRKMNIVLLGHFQVKKFDDPATHVPYDRYQMKLSHDKVAALYRESVDFVFFANFKVAVKTADAKAKKGKGVGGEARVIYTEKRASHDAKNRFSLPPEMPFDYSAVVTRINATEVDQLKVLRDEVTELIAEVTDPELKSKAQVTFDDPKYNASIEGLKFLKNRLLKAME